jgi:hypothetical protein
MPARINKNNYKTRKTKNNKKTQKFQKGGAQSNPPRSTRPLPMTPDDKEQALKEAINLANASYYKAVEKLRTAYPEEITELEKLDENAKNYYKIIGYLNHNKLTKSNNANSGIYATINNSNANSRIGWSGNTYYVYKKNNSNHMYNTTESESTA